MKRMLTVLLTLALLTSLAGGAAEEQVKITLWHCVTDAAGETLKEYTQAFAADSGMAVETVFQGTYKDAVTKMNGIMLIFSVCIIVSTSENSSSVPKPPG